MAIRPVFVSDDVSYEKTVDTEFDYFAGCSKVQRQRCIESLHKSYIRSYPEGIILEVSSYSKDELGIKLSAFNLLITLNDGSKVPVEVAFQAGKIFENGGPYKDLLYVSSKKAKTDPRLRESGRIIGFDFEGRSFPTEPVRLFYTWLYLRALSENMDLANQLYEFNSFSDIVFNPKKSINCQAYACAVYVSLRSKNEFSKALEDIDFLSVILGKTSLPKINGLDNLKI